MMSVEDARLESVVGGARNANNWLATADQLLHVVRILDQTGDRTRMESLLTGTRMSMLTGSGADIKDIHAEWLNKFDMSMGCGRVAMMLRGCAVENLLKGILIARDPAKWAEKKATRIYRWNHDIARLAADAAIDLSPAEQTIAKQLTLFIDCGGRYPTGQTPAEHGTGASWSTDDRPVADGLIARLREMLVGETQPKITKVTA